MSAPRQGYFLRAESRIGKVRFSAALADAVGPRARITVDGGIVIEPTDAPAVGSTSRRLKRAVYSVHAIGTSCRGVVSAALWWALPDRRVDLERDGDTWKMSST